ncbi:hemolysin III family protein [Rhodobacteraceae bacterium NNCM2]|nr:hemolysin III family protein [Coraliihabitans acroporae]
MTENPIYPSYTRAERMVDATIHFAGVMTSVFAVPVLITLVAVWHGDFSTITATSIYGVSLIAMFACSASYHIVTRETVKEVLRRLDHSAIYILIAATYTPFVVLANGEFGYWVMAGVWVAALTGVTLQMLAYRKLEWLALVLYLAMGWTVVVFGWPILSSLSEPTVILIAIGGLIYTIGVGFHLWHRLPFHNAIWHGFVLVASFVFYAAVMVENRMVALAAG